MDEYVLSTNDKLVPIPPVVYEWFCFQATSDTAQSYTIDFNHYRNLDVVYSKLYGYFSVLSGNTSTGPNKHQL